MSRESEHIKFSAPGSAMLMGEHAVLHGKHCLVTALNRRLHVSLKPQENDEIKIISSLGEHRTSIGNFSGHKDLKFICTALEYYLGILPSGLELKVESAIAHDRGYGTSAAVTAASLAALDKFCSLQFNPAQIFKAGLKVIRAVQGQGSGADLLASVYGGLLKYRAQPFSYEEVRINLPLTLVYSGSKMPASEVLRLVDSWRKKNPDLYETLDDLIDQAVLAAHNYLRAGNFNAFYETFNFNQGLLDALGVNNKRLSDLIYSLRSCPEVKAAKISGSGLGDCVVCIGQVPETFKPAAEVVEIELQGLKDESSN